MARVRIGGRLRVDDRRRVRVKGRHLFSARRVILRVARIADANDRRFGGAICPAEPGREEILFHRDAAGLRNSGLAADEELSRGEIEHLETAVAPLRQRVVLPPHAGRHRHLAVQLELVADVRPELPCPQRPGPEIVAGLLDADHRRHDLRAARVRLAQEEVRKCVEVIGRTRRAQRGAAARERELRRLGFVVVLMETLQLSTELHVVVPFGPAGVQVRAPLRVAIRARLAAAGDRPVVDAFIAGIAVLRPYGG